MNTTVKAKANIEDDPLAIPDMFKRKPGDRPEPKVEPTRDRTQPRPKAKANGKAETGKKAANSAQKTATDARISKSKGKAAPTKSKPSAAPKTAKVSAAPKAKGKGSVELDKYGLKVGTNQSKAAALYGRKEGATTDDMKKEFGGPQLVVLTIVEANGFKVKKVKETNKEGKSRTRYFIL